MFPGQPPRIEVGGENGTGVSENGLKVFKFRDERPGDEELRTRLAPPPTDGVAAKVKGAVGEEKYNQLFPKSGKGTGATSNTDVTLDLHGRNIQAILQAWDEGRDAETAGAEARKSVAIILAMYESARKNGAAVEVK
jgi:hypothetical protein